jgi:cytidyltransferase-like protein
LVQKYAGLIALYPGSFDPITLGHLDIISRGSRLFDRVIVLVSSNPNKVPLFSIDQRLEQIRQTISHLRNVDVDHYDGLTITYAKKHNAKVLLRGYGYFQTSRKSCRWLIPIRPLPMTLRPYFWQHLLNMVSSAVVWLKKLPALMVPSAILFLTM